MRTPCTVCGRLIPVGSGGLCPQHRPQARRMRATARWTALSRNVRSRGVCAVCGRSAAPGELEADHIVPAAGRPDLFFDPRNVRAVCRWCHYARLRRLPKVGSE